MTKKNCNCGCVITLLFLILACVALKFLASLGIFVAPIVLAAIVGLILILASAGVAAALVSLLVPPKMDILKSARASQKLLEILEADTAEKTRKDKREEKNGA